MSSRSTSAIIARAVSGHHLLKIDGHSQTKVVTNSSDIKSCTFHVGRHAWRINYYPNGQGSDNANYIYVFIQLASVSTDLPFKPDKGISAQCVLSLLDRAGKPVPSYTLTFDRSFTTPQGEWGWHKFITRSELENSGCLKDDCFTLRCDITVTELRAEETEDRDFTDLLWKKEGADVAFHVGGETIVAHRRMQGVGRKKGGAGERSSEARKNMEELKRIMTGVEKLDKRSDELRVEPFPSPSLARGADLALRLLEGEIRRPPQEVRRVVLGVWVETLSYAAHGKNNKFNL
uniref:Uncharacterized protein n=1 Tax=Aegilops tauschii TaxID=37682 RepID=N1R040_AEGTA